MRKKKLENSLTTPDLVLLSLLAERAMHGYQANALLEQRQVRDWAGVSRPQVYYSLEKLTRMGFLREVRSGAESEGPERRVLATTAAGRAALSEALAREDWTTQRERPAFLTWMALSWQADARVVRQQIARRRSYIENELQRERVTLESVLEEVGHREHEAIWMISLAIDQFETELRWLERIENELPRRTRAKHPAYPPDDRG